jgi:tRNA pseudouridine38-40 synthase
LIYRYFTELSYNGFTYVGWQRQPNGRSIQEELEKCMSLKTGQKVEIVGAGRTDAGVHARFYIAHFDLQTELENIPEFIYRLNSFLPADIAIHKIYRVASDAHARFDAIRRTYDYQFLFTKNPFLTDYSWYIRQPLNLKLMKEAAAILLFYEDFTTFSKLHTDVKTNNCEIYEAQFIENEQNLVFRISANRFLRNMVRAIVGTLVEVGRENLSVSDFERIIQLKDRSAAAASAPAKGLFLVNVVYPEKVYLENP